MDKQELFSILSVLLVAVVSQHAVKTQQTFMRSCECEYTANGQCAYTLLLPLSPQQGDSALCPAATTSHPDGDDIDDTVTSELSTRVLKLYEDVEQLASNLSMLMSTSGEQSRMLSQLQSKVMAHTDAIANIESTITNMTSTSKPTSPVTQQDCNKCEEISEQVRTNAQRVLDLNSDIEAIKRDLSEIRTQMTSLRSDLSLISNSASTIETMNQTLATVARDVTDAINDVTQRVDSYALCMRKGILVSGSVERIENEAISASSEMENATVVMGRIQQGGEGDGDGGAWCPMNSGEPNNEEWIQFDLGRKRTIYGVVTKGRADYQQWVTSYKVQYSADNTTDVTTFTNVVGDEEIFVGNNDQNTAQTHLFLQPIMARYIRFLPLSAYLDRNKCLRADVIGCLDS